MSNLSAHRFRECKSNHRVAYLAAVFLHYELLRESRHVGPSRLADHASRVWHPQHWIADTEREVIRALRILNKDVEVTFRCPAVPFFLFIARQARSQGLLDTIAQPFPVNRAPAYGYPFG